MKKIIICLLVLAWGSSASAQSNRTERAGTIHEVIQVNPHKFVGKLIDAETQKEITFISNRPVEVSELVIFLMVARPESIQDEAKGFSSLIR